MQKLWTTDVDISLEGAGTGLEFLHAQIHFTESDSPFPLRVLPTEKKPGVQYRVLSVSYSFSHLSFFWRWGLHLSAPSA